MVGFIHREYRGGFSSKHILQLKVTDLYHEFFTGMEKAKH